MDRPKLSVRHLIGLLQDPEKALSYSFEEWLAVLEAGQRNLLLGQLLARLTSTFSVELLPDAVQRHLLLASLTSRRRIEAALWEVNTIRKSLSEEIPIILLKGVAYAACKDANAMGRLFTDIDLLVPRQFLDEAEVGLFTQGWQPGRVDDYDQKYYREWMHELPPMTHVRRQTVVDLHHSIIPNISRFRFPCDLLLRDVVTIAPGLFALSPVDRIIHCALHVLIEGEPGKVLRELYDLHALIEQHASGPSEMERVLTRASELGLKSLVSHSMDAAKVVYGPALPIRKHPVVTQWLVDVALSSEEDPFRVRTARIGLLSYSHWIKMPLQILLPHLARKSFMETFPARAM